MGSTLKGKNLLIKNDIFSLRVDLVELGENGKAGSPDRVSLQFNGRTKKYVQLFIKNSGHEAPMPTAADDRLEYFSLFFRENKT